MPFTFVQSARSDNSTTVALNGVAAGNLIVLSSKWEGTQGVILSVSDGTSPFELPSSNNFTPGINVSTAGGFAFLRASTSGNKTYTVTVPGGGGAGGFQRTCVMEFSYLGGTVEVENGHGADGTSGTAMSSGIMIADAADLLAIGAFFENSGQSVNTPLFNGVAPDNTEGTPSNGLSFQCSKSITGPFQGDFSATIAISTQWVMAGLLLRIQPPNAPGNIGRRIRVGEGMGRSENHT